MNTPPAQAQLFRVSHSRFADIFSRLISRRSVKSFLDWPLSYLHDYANLQATFVKELKSAGLTVQSYMDSTAKATVNGNTNTLTPQGRLVKAADGKPA